MEFHERLYIGRNYIETLLLTLTYHEMNHPTLGVKEYITQRLEEEIRALGLAIPSIMKIYRENVLKNFKLIAKDVPEPLLDKPTIYSEIVKHIDKYKTKIIENYKALSENELNRRIKEISISIVRPAIISTLYQAGLVRLKLK